MNVQKLIAALIVFGCLFPACSEESGPPASGHPDSEIMRRVEELLSEMTLQEKIGQMTQTDRAYLIANRDIQRYNLGGLCSGGDFGPRDNSPKGWADMVDYYQQYALSTRLKIPLMYGIDVVHGNGHVRDAVVFPHNIGLGCTRNPALVEEAGRITAKEVAGTGIDWAFAPCIAVPRDERWGRTYEGFGETPELAVEIGAATVRGLQGAIEGDPKKVLACAKHYVADGGTEGGKDGGDAKISEEELRRIHLPGYIAAIKAGVGSIMVSYSSWNGEKMHANRYLITDVLKGELGFQGIVASDWAPLDDLPGKYEYKVESSINAGIDMFMIPLNYPVFITVAQQLVEEGKIPMARIDDAVRRILIKKMELGLFEYPFPVRSLTPQVGSAEHRAVARECVRQSMVLLKNEHHLLPLAKNLSRIHVAGTHGNNVGYQCGGWTVTWQGGSGAITTGTTILEGIQQAVSPDTEVTYSKSGSGASGADVGIVVIGETPYAEMLGDRDNLDLSLGDQLTLFRVKSAGIPVVAVLISGRPMIIEPLLEYCDAFIAAWLPGTEGQGVADVLFGDYNPTGKLSHSWPRTMSQIPLNIGDPQYDPLFPYGYGLSYRKALSGKAKGMYEKKYLKKEPSSW